MGVADRVRAVDPLELERRGHLDIGDHDIRSVLRRRCEERRGVLGHADDIDVLVRVQEGTDALPYEHVVLTQDDPDRHLPNRSRGACTIRP